MEAASRNGLIILNMIAFDDGLNLDGDQLSELGRHLCHRIVQRV